MVKLGWKGQWELFGGWFGVGVQLLVMTVYSEKTPVSTNPESINNLELTPSPPVQLRIQEDKLVMDNGLVNVTLSIPNGMVTGIQYNGIDNLLEQNKETNRGYWDVVWDDMHHRKGIYDLLEGTSFEVIMEDENQIELSFIKTWDFSLNKTRIPLNIDKRFIMLRGCPGFYSYAIFERLEGWPDMDIYQGRLVFKPQQKLFHYMVISDERQKLMPTSKDRENGKILEYPEAVLLSNSSHPAFKVEVDDKYQFSCDSKDNRVHGWISSDPPMGFWMITPSIEFRSAGPFKQDLTSHVGPTILSMFFSTHYAGSPLAIKLREGEPWKKVFGPVLVYLNSAALNDDPLTLWVDAKEQTEDWPYDFPISEDYPYADQRGTISGRLLVHDKYISKELMTARSAYVGLAPPGDVGSWQRENKGYQFWTQTDAEGYFLIKNIRVGNYSLYAWVPGFIGDYKYEFFINITPGSKIRLRVLVYDPPRNGPTLWEIGIPDRTAAEFYVPDPSPTLMNQLYTNRTDKFRQYGLWDRYTDLYPDQDLTYTIGISNYQTDWFFAHVNRKTDNKKYVPTTWKILFDLQNVIKNETYTLQLALASAHEAELQVRINDQEAIKPHFTTGFIGKDNAIARHGIHGLYWLYSVGVSGSQLVNGENAIFLKQPRGSSPFNGFMYDYIRLEGPPENF